MRRGYEDRYGRAFEADRGSEDKHGRASEAERGYEDRHHMKVFEAAARNVEELKEVLELEKVPLTITNRQGHNLAHIAVKNDNVRVLEYLLRKEPSLLDLRDRYRCSVLHQAVVKGSLNSVKYLVEEHGVDICELGGKFDDRSAVHVAVEFNHLHIVKYFVEDRKVDFNVPNPSQKTPPIFLTVKHRNWDVIEYLIGEKDADVTQLNYNQENILFPIVRENFMGFLKYLLDEKKFDLDVNWRSHSGETIVHIAAGHGRLNILKYLVEEKDAPIDVQKTTDKKTPLHYAALQDDFEICEFLISRGANAGLRDRSGDRPAQKASNGRLIDYLVDKAFVKRSPRSVPSLHSPPEVRAPLEFLTPRRDIGHAASSTDYNAQIKSFSLSSGSNLTFQHFLLLASSMTGAIKGQSFPSPASIIRSRMSSIAIDAIDRGIDFSNV